MTNAGKLKEKAGARNRVAQQEQDELKLADPEATVSKNMLTRDVKCIGVRVRIVRTPLNTDQNR